MPARAMSAAVVVVLAALAATASAAPEVSIMSYGAVANDSSVVSCAANSRAIEAAAAAATPGGVAVVPAGMGPFYVSATQLSGLVNVTLRLEGWLLASTDIAAWPNATATVARPVLLVANSTGVTVDGGGGMDGQGYGWWWAAILKRIPNVNGGRPHLVHVQTVDGLVVRNITLSNSAQFHLKLNDVRGVLVEDFEVFVDVEGERGQVELLRRHGLIDPETRLPTFPLNTDGIDLWACDVEVRNSRITNFDDAVVPKPSHHGSGRYCNCSHNIWVHDMYVKYSVGMTIGSVPPHTGNNCVRDVLFEDVYMEDALKSIYIKSDPGDSGTGLIQNITYRNFEVHRPIWWFIYIGPQQMAAGYGGPGCMLYPLVPECPTQPLVTIKDIFIYNVTAVDGIMPSPGIIRGNSTNPYTNIVLSNVTYSSWLDEGWICENANVTAVAGTYPVPKCRVAD